MSSSPPPDSRQSIDVEGYDKLALFFGNHPQMMMFRAFSMLGGKYSTYLQAQLSHLEKDLEDASRMDRESEDPEKRNYQYSWWDLHRARKDEDFQIRKIEEIGKVLKEYCQIKHFPLPCENTPLWKAMTNPFLGKKDNWLLLLKEVFKLEPASSTDLDFLRKWLEDPEEGNNFLKNTFAEREAWYKPDLVSICVNEQMDTLTKWIHDMLPWFHEHFGCRFMVLPTFNLLSPFHHLSN